MLMGLQSVQHTIVAADHTTNTANADVLGAKLAALDTSGVDFTVEYDSTTNTPSFGMILLENLHWQRCSW